MSEASNDLRCWAGETGVMVGPLLTFLISFLSAATSGGGLIAKSCPTLATLLRVPCPWDSLGENTQVGCHFLFHRYKWF